MCGRHGRTDAIVEFALPPVTDLTHATGDGNPGGVRHHQRIEGRLIDAGVEEDLQITLEALSALARQIEDEIGIERGQHVGGHAQAVGDLGAAAIGPHGSQQRIVEALHPHRQPADAESPEAFEQLQVQVIGIGLHRDAA